MIKALRTPLILSAGIAIGVSLATSQGVLAKKEDMQALPLEDLQTFVEIMNRVKADYVEDVSDAELLENAIRGMLAGLDPHSAYLDSEEFRDITIATSGQFGGLGIEVQMHNGWVRVVAPIDDTPAARAGIEPGDYIIKIDETPVKGMTLSDAVKQMRGKPGSKLKISVVREGEAAPFDLTLERAIINVSSVRSRFLEPGIGYVRVSTFSSTTGDSLKEEVNKLAKQASDDKQSLKGLVLDLRNNPGGLLNQAIAVSDAFLEEGEIVSTRGRDAADGDRTNATPGDLAEGKPIVVLINGGSASASEIVAGALQDHRRAIVVGTKSFGKGSVQTIMPLRGEGAMRLTTARYYTPSGRSIQALGVSPDIIVAQPPAQPADSEEEDATARPLRSEADLRGSLNNDSLTDDQVDQIMEDRAKAEKAASLREEDYQLAYAIDILKGLSALGPKK